MRRLLGIAALAALAFATHSFVRGLIAKPATPIPALAADRQPRIEVLAGPRVHTVEVPPGSVERARQHPPFSPEPMTRGARSVRLAEVSAEGGDIFIAGWADLYERDDPHCFAWDVKVLDEDGENVVVEWPYTDDLFCVEPGAVATHYFMDTLFLGLERGDYILELTAIDVLEEGDTSGLYASRRPFTIE